MISSHIPLANTKLHGETQMLRRMRNTTCGWMATGWSKTEVLLLLAEEGRMYSERQLAVSATVHSLVTHIFLLALLPRYKTHVSPFEGGDTMFHLAAAFILKSRTSEWYAFPSSGPPVTLTCIFWKTSHLSSQPPPARNIVVNETQDHKNALSEEERKGGKQRSLDHCNDVTPTEIRGSLT